MDNTGNGHNSGNYNVISTTDRFNTMMRALYFSGSGTEFLNYGDVDDFERWIQQSFSFWVLPDSHGASADSLKKPILSKWSAPSDLANSSYNILMNGSDLCFILSDGISTDTAKASLSNIFLGQWSHVVITFNYGITKIYINNVLVTDTILSVSQIMDSNRDFKVGDWYQSDDANFSSFQGKIDDLGIWNRELDVCEVDALFTGNICLTASLHPKELEKPELIGITDLLGRKTIFQPNTPLIFIYSDGSTEKVFHFE